MNGRIEIREQTPGGPVELVGYGATFDSPYKVGTFTETIRPGAFKRSLGETPDVALLVNHSGTPLARTTSGTMTVSEDSRGLAFRAELEPTDPDVMAILPKLKRGDLTECSFAFRATAQTWSDDKTERTIRECSIHRGDISIVTNAANPTATAALRKESLSLEARERIAARVGERVCGPAGILRTYESASAPTSLVKSYVPEAKANRARVNAGRSHPGTDASTEGHEPGPRYTDAELAKLGAEGKALRKKDGSYGWPIVDRRDLLNALADLARVAARLSPAERSRVKAWIKLRAVVMSLDRLLPASWYTPVAKLHPSEKDRLGE